MRTMSKPGAHESHQDGVDDDGLGHGHDDLEEDLEAGCAVDAGGFIQGLRNRIEEALGDVVAHAGGGAGDQDQAGDGARLGQT